MQPSTALVGFALTIIFGFLGMTHVPDYLAWGGVTVGVILFVVGFMLFVNPALPRPSPRILTLVCVVAALGAAGAAWALDPKAPPPREKCAPGTAGTGIYISPEARNNTFVNVNAGYPACGGKGIDVHGPNNHFDHVTTTPVPTVPTPTKPKA